jgi:hypothetical protein
VNNSVVQQKPRLLWRFLLILMLAGFASMENNPVVKLEAMLGLSPSPIERLFGIKSLFSGMTEGVHQFVRMNLKLSIMSNLFAPFVMPIAIYCVLTWKIPKIDTRKKEYIFFAIFIGLSVVINIVN